MAPYCKLRSETIIILLYRSSNCTVRTDIISILCSRSTVWSNCMQNDISLFDPKMSGRNHDPYTVVYSGFWIKIRRCIFFSITFLLLYVPLYLVEGGVFQYYRMKMISILWEMFDSSSSRKCLVVAKISSEEWRNKCNSKGKKLFEIQDATK